MKAIFALMLFCVPASAVEPAEATHVREFYQSVQGICSQEQPKNHNFTAYEQFYEVGAIEKTRRSKDIGSRQ